MPKDPKMQRRRGLRGGRPRKYPHTIPPPELALPPKHRGGPNGPIVTFPVDPATWEIFCGVYAGGMGKVLPACMASGLDQETVSHWFRLARKGQEPWRSQIGKALAQLAITVGKVGVHLAKRDPLAWLHRAMPDQYPLAPVETTRVEGQLVVVVPDFAAADPEPQRVASRGSVDDKVGKA